MNLSEITAERAVRRIDMTPLKRRFTTELNMLVKLIEGYNFKLRIVGGAVRDVLLGLSPRDIDLITDALPDQVMFILGKHKVPYSTKGIPHGTVKVKFPDGEEYEITSLGFKVEDECCPPDVVVHSGESWRGDAERRDFTVDTMSLTFDGLLYDYLNGIQDLRNQYVKFVGSPSEAIQKDPILIMRFFKILSLFRDPKFDKSVLPILKDKMNLVKKIKPERLEKEISNIKRGQSADKVLKMMKNLGFDDVIADIKECWMIVESAEHLVPALKLIRYSEPDDPGFVWGQKGQTHGDVYSNLAPQIINNTDDFESGFYDMLNHKYLTRDQARELVTGRPGAPLHSEELNGRMAH